MGTIRYGSIFKVSSAAVCVLAVGLASSQARAATSSPSVSSTGPSEVNVTGGLGAGEPELAIDPVHHTLVISFDSNQGCGIALSSDAGQTWHVRFPSPADPGPTPGDPVHQCSDPTAAAGPNGTLYVGAGFWDTPGGYVDYYNMYVSRSTDGGYTWSPPVFATGDRDLPANILSGGSTGHSDREFLAVDNTTNTLYVSATDAARTSRWIKASHDQGQTFGPLHPIDSPSNPQAPQDYIPAAADGVLAVSYFSAVGPHPCPCGIFETSTDDGATWNRHWAPIPAQWTAADPSHPGRFAIMSGQGPSDTTFTPDVVMVSTTSDYGKTWSPPVAIGQNPPNQRYEPWINYSPDGVLAVGYKTLYGATSYGGLNGPIGDFTNSNGSFDYWAAVSPDGGSSFDTPIRVSHAVSPPESYGGDDFSYVALDNRYLYATWADMLDGPNGSAGGERTVWFAREPLG